MAKLMKTNTNKYRKNVFTEILENIDTDNNLPENSSNKDLLKYAFERFESEYCFSNNMRRYPNEQIRLSNWLSGLALPFVEGYNYNILEQTARLHEVERSDFTDKQVNTILNNYFNHMAFMMLKLKEYNFTKNPLNL